MIFILFLALVAGTNEEFFKMVEEKQAQGCDWHYVGRTEVANEIALPAVEEDGTKIYYWHICEK